MTTISTTADMLLMKEYELSPTMDARIGVGWNDITSDMDMVIQNIITKTFDSDVLLVFAQDLEIDSDMTLIKLGEILQFDSDIILKLIDEMLLFDSDMILKASFILSPDSDMILKAVFTQTFDTDMNLVNRATVSPTLDILLLEQDLMKTFTMDMTLISSDSTPRREAQGYIRKGTEDIGDIRLGTEHKGYIRKGTEDVGLIA